MKIYMIAGEASGDLHGANLVKSILKKSPESTIRCWGGDKMESAGAELIKHYRDLAFMGFVEVLLHIRTILKNISFCKKDIEAFQPDVLVLIDYPGFNMRIAEWAKSKGIRVVYYISPQIWAWKQGRVHKIKATVNDMCVVLPFEEDFYKKFDYPVQFVGHPLLDEIQNRDNRERKNIIALLPGSRKQEINAMLPIMMEASKNFKDFEIVVAGAPGQNASFYQPFLEGYNARLEFGKTYEIMQTSKIGLVSSGTATLESGLFKLPQVVCYKGSGISVWIARKIVKIKYISLVNLILDRPAVLELIQQDLTVSKLHEEMDALLYNESRKLAMERDYEELYEKLGGPGASDKTATIVLKSSL